MNDTDRRILSLLDKGLSIDRVAKRIGRPGDRQRVIDAIKREKYEEWKELGENFRKSLHPELQETMDKIMEDYEKENLT